MLHEVYFGKMKLTTIEAPFSDEAAMIFHESELGKAWGRLYKEMHNDLESKLPDHATLKDQKDLNRDKKKIPYVKINTLNF